MPEISDLIGMIEAWALRTPEKAAHVSGDQSLSFAQLVERSDALAHHLDAELGADRSPVAVFGHKEPEMLVAFLAVVKTGRAYVPLDSSLPPERVSAITELAGVRLTLVPAKIAALPSLTEARGRYPRAPFTANTPFYIIFTSGSTGEPKGVVITHACLQVFVSWMLAEQGFAESGEIFLNQAPFSFDLSVMDLYLSLTTGGTLFSITASDIQDPARLHRLLAESGITTWVSTPSFARLCLSEPSFSAERVPSIRRFLFCGETLLRETAEQLLARFPSAQVWNTYGPTEATVATTSIRLDSTNVAQYPALPVGFPMPGCKIVIIDEQVRPLPAGTVGEILIVGPNVSPGYLNLPETNRKTFIKFDGEPAYRTGDWGRMAQGLLFFEGRHDGQIKYHGYRIELGEIETLLNRHPAVREAVTLLLDEPGTGAGIVAYVVFKPGHEVGKRELREFLGKRLPAYAIPGAFVPLSSLPLTANGKLDRKALPPPHLESASDRTVIAPRNEMEKIVAGVWSKVLAVEKISVDDNFFDLGGHSLLAAEIAAEIHTVTGRQVPVAWSFHAATVEALCQQIGNAALPIDDGAVVGIHTDGSRTPFFCICGFFDLARHLGPDQPFYQLGWQRLAEISDPQSAFQQLAQQALQEIRAAQPSGPYRLGGHSLGAVVAFDVALRLQKLGEKVEVLALLDPDLPNMSGWSRLRRAFGLGSRYLRRMGKLSFADRWRTILKSKRWHSAVFSAKRKAADSFGEMSVDEKMQALEGSYVPSTFQGKVVVFIAGDTDTNPLFEPRLDWGRFATRGAVVHSVPGGHESFAREPNVRVLASILRKELIDASRLTEGHTS